MFDMFDKIKNVPVGTRYTICQIGYYNFWYPSIEKSEQGLLDNTVSGFKLDWVGGAGEWVPYQVTGHTAKKYGSPIKVMWFAKEGDKNG